MKYLSVKPAMLVLAAALILTACNVTSHTETATGIDFSQYKTFAWVNSATTGNAGRSDNDIVDNNIKNSVSDELAKKGWAETDGNSDGFKNEEIVEPEKY